MRRFWNARFAPLLAGGTLRDRLVACLGALVGVLLAALTYREISPFPTPLLAAPIGASAVLVFAVPASPLAQPWSVVGGNTISLAVGIAVIALLPHQPLAAALAIALAILAMSLTGCLHPPGGAVALSTVLAAPALTAVGLAAFAAPILINSVLLVALGWAFHRYSGHSYPHRPVPVKWRETPPAPAAGILMEDVDQALADLGETFDVAREDLVLLLAQAEAHAAARLGAPPPVAPAPLERA
ncbi:CBS domain-containing membrane protein [Sphingomonas zeicaulis]|uniref:HPP family protein n=1 Tax=Sphingomonas zeicaulis TaxID=1632740 RepID=UPI003D1BD9CA